MIETAYSGVMVALLQKAKTLRGLIADGRFQDAEEGAAMKRRNDLLIERAWSLHQESVRELNSLFPEAAAR